MKMSSQFLRSITWDICIDVGLILTRVVFYLFSPCYKRIYTRCVFLTSNKDGAVLLCLTSYSVLIYLMRQHMFYTNASESHENTNNMCSVY